MCIRDRDVVRAALAILDAPVEFRLVRHVDGTLLEIDVGEVCVGYLAVAKAGVKKTFEQVFFVLVRLGQESLDVILRIFFWVVGRLARPILPRQWKRESARNKKRAQEEQPVPDRRVLRPDLAPDACVAEPIDVREDIVLCDFCLLYTSRCV